MASRAFSFSFARTLPCLALVLAPLSTACFEDHTVVEDVGPDASTTTDAATRTDAATCPGVEACNEPDVPVGCHLGAGSCDDGAYTCPGVICPGDAGGCAGQPAPPCAAPPPGCNYVGPECVDGHLGCGTLACSDAGTCTPQGACVVPPIPSGCSLGPVTSLDGVCYCPQVICPDGGAADADVCVEVDLKKYDTTCTQASDCIPVGHGEICADNCGICPSAAVNASEQSRYNAALATLGQGEPCGCPEYGNPTCIAGECALCNGPNPPAACAQAIDGGSAPFVCGDGGPTCDAATQYCSIIEGGAVQPDGGTHVSMSCEAIPSACSMGAGPHSTCACLEAGTSGMCTVMNGDYTVTVEAP